MLFSHDMCGRYSAAGNLSELAKLIDFICRAPFFALRYNTAPRQQAPVILLENGEPTMKLMRWGLIPGWAKDESIGDKLINARAEPRCRDVFNHHDGSESDGCRRSRTDARHFAGHALAMVD